VPWVIRRVLLSLPGPFFVLAGVLHFTNPGFYRPMMPDYLPAHDPLIYASGVAEIAGGVGLMSSNHTIRRGAMWWLLATLVAVFPANINMALNPEKFPDVPGGQPTLIARLPFQLLFGWWVWKAADDSARQS
jgi:uncharacterized membrane protein